MPLLPDKGDPELLVAEVSDQFQRAAQAATYRFSASWVDA